MVFFLLQVSASSLALVYGLENIVDFLSSAVVLWRFFAPTSVDSALEAKLAKREKRASMAISMILIFLGFYVIVASIDDFAKGQEVAHDMQLVAGVSFLSILVFGMLSALKFRYSKVLDSSSLYKDGICSTIGTICAIGLFLNAVIIGKNPGAWWIDPTIALLAGIFAILYGCYGVWHAMAVEKIPICSCSWWAMSDGDTDTGKKPEVELKASKSVEQSDLV